jgi:hypothetical protein
MDITRVVAELRDQLAAVDAAIAAMERLQEGKRRRGRPSGSTRPAADPAPGEPVRQARKPKRES